MSTPLPHLMGQYFVTRMGGATGFWIGLGEQLLGDPGDYQHAGLCIGDQVVEAMPGGAILTPLSVYLTPPHWGQTRWSRLDLTDGQRLRVAAAGLALVGTPYNPLDYAYLGLVRHGIRPTWLREWVADPKRLICSQLVDRAYYDAGYHLFSDDVDGHPRDFGDVTPGDLTRLMTNRGSEYGEGS